MEKKPCKNPLINHSAKKKQHETGKKAHAGHIYVFKMYPGKIGIQKKYGYKRVIFFFRARPNLLNGQDIWMYCRLDQSYECCCSGDMGLLGFLVL